MRVFITGCGGFLGSHLADAFLARGDQVVGCDSLVGGEVENVPHGVDFYVGDCNDFDKLKRAMRAVDVVYHCAATAHEGLSSFSPHENAQNGYAASAAVFSAACAVRAKRVVFTSSMARYGKGERPPPFTEDMVPMPEDPYAIGKHASEALLENLCETHGVEWSIAVPHSIIGPRQRFCDPYRNVASIFIHLMLQGRQPFIYDDGSQERCFSFVSDCVNPLVRMATEECVRSEVINIGPDEGVVTILELAERIATLMGFKLEPIFMPGRPREVKLAHCSANKARRLLGYETKIGLDEGLIQMIEWVRAKGPKPFLYRTLPIEIESPKLPETWGKRLF